MDLKPKDSLRTCPKSRRQILRWKKAMTKKMRFRKTFLCIFTSLAALIPLFNVAAEEEAEQVPTSFIRDIMQPIGMPVVTSFHAVRENLFLNTRVIDGTTLEKIGNFFLTPSQYLFAGKTIAIHNRERLDFDVSQSFSYGKWNWLKTLLALIALPVAEPIGISIKGISYLSSEVAERHEVIGAALRAKIVSSQNERYRLKGIEDFHSDEFIPCLGYKRPSFLTKKQKIEIKALKTIVSLLEAHNIIYWIDFGTCLGAYRHGGIIPWDWDIDIAILQDDHENVKRILSTLNAEEYQIQDWSSYNKPKTLLKLFVKETKNFIDIYHYKIDEKEKNISYVFTYADTPLPESWKKADLEAQKPLGYELIFPLKKAKFDGMIIWAPNKVTDFLQSKYGENLEPAMIWDEAQMAYLKVADHPYWKS